MDNTATPLTTPVLLLVFNRPDTTRQVFDAIRRARPTRLYVAADGPRPERPTDDARCAEVRQLATQVDWDCQLTTLFRDQNLGCGLAPAAAISWFFEHEPHGIILEDDCVPADSFFGYCQELLQRYADDTRVMHISGNNYLGGYQRDPDYAYYFSHKTDCWGWATWRRAWAHYDFHIPQFPELKRKGYLDDLFSNTLERVYRLSKIEQTYFKGDRTDVWDYQWEFTVFSQSGLCIVPQVNLVRNVGFGADATHTHNPMEARMTTQDIALPLTHPPFVIRDTRSDGRNYRQLMTKKGFGKLRQLINLN